METTSTPQEEEEEEEPRVQVTRIFLDKTRQAMNQTVHMRPSDLV
jgi:hypothetical protein